MARVFGGKINWFRHKNSAKRRAHDLENQESGRLGTKIHDNSRIQFASNESKWVPSKLNHGKTLV
jgi:hypothetical protein